MSLEKETINPDRETMALEDQDSPEKVKERVERILTGLLFATISISHGKKPDMVDKLPDRLFRRQEVTESPSKEKS